MKAIIVSKFLIVLLLLQLSFQADTYLVQQESQPEEIDNLERKRMQLEVELHALDKEKDRTSKHRLVQVQKEFDDLREKLQPLKMKYKKVKETSDAIRRLKKKREDLAVAIQEAERKEDAIRIADLKYGGCFCKDFEATTDENLMLTVGPDAIAEDVSRLTGIPVTRLGTSEKETYWSSRPATLTSCRSRSSSWCCG